VFTGIVEGKGKVVCVEHRGQVKRLILDVAAGLTEISLGDSINVNGACLTVIEKRGQNITVDVSSETIQRTTFRNVREGEEVNLERALRLMDRLGGHIVTGHIDGTGVITEKRSQGDFILLRIRAPEAVMRYTVEKGSIAVDGISLTVNVCRGDEIGLTLIPFTLDKTILMAKRIGHEVNLEADILGKYVERLLGSKAGGRGGLDEDFLRSHGYLKE
jgi:riboflavin synthase